MADLESTDESLRGLIRQYIMAAHQHSQDLEKQHRIRKKLLEQIMGLGYKEARIEQIMDELVAKLREDIIKLIRNSAELTADEKKVADLFKALNAFHGQVQDPEHYSVPHALREVERILKLLDGHLKHNISIAAANQRIEKTIEQLAAALKKID